MLQNIGIEKAWTCTHSPKRNKQKPFPQKITATVSILVLLQNSNSDIQLSNFSWFDSTGLTQPVNRVAYTTDYSVFFSAMARDQV